MKELKGFLLRVLYLGLACAMFYFTDQGVTVGGIGIMYQYLLALAIIALALAVFLVKPDTHRMAVTLQCSWVLSAHYLWVELYSMLVWVLVLSPVNIMMRGSFAVVYVLIGVLTAGATVYLFGREGVRLLIGGLLLADAIYVLQAIAENGAGTFFREYLDLIVSFTSRTGPVMKSFESLNFAYMLGFFLLYQVVEELFDRRLRKQGLLKGMPQLLKEWWLFPLAGACFLLGLKRSVLMAMATGILVVMLLLRLPLKETRRAARIMCILLVVFGFGYVIACYYGVMDWLESIGIDTSSRAHFFGELRQYYEMGIGYFGKGVGYVSRMMQDGEMVIRPSNGYTPLDIHNDYLRQYIELGFFGFLIWMVLFLCYKNEYFFHRLENERDRLHGILALSFTVANYITFMTENTLYFCKLTMMTSLLIMAYHFEDYCGMEAEYG